MYCPKCWTEMEEDRYYYENEILIVYKCPKCGKEIREHHPRESPWNWVKTKFAKRPP